VYTIVVFLACTIGPIVGLGGGVFIRPVFDAIGYHPVLAISFYSSIAILSMSIVSTIKKVQDGMTLKVSKAVSISAGAIIGGFAGNQILVHLVYRMYAESSVQLVQIAITVILLTMAILATLKQGLRYEIKSKIILPFIIGIGLGAFAAFLGIGGGPINVPILMILFGMPIKAATMYSIVIIFFSHASRLVTLAVDYGFTSFDLSLLPFLIIAAAVGGLVGANLSRIFSEKTVKRAFIAALLAVIALNLFNGIVIITG